MPRNTIKKQMTLCGTLARAELGGGRAKVIARDGNKLTYRVYYSRGGERLRLSNHEVPTTAEREDAKFTWAKHGWQVITARSSLDACHREIDEMEEAIADE